MTDSLENVSDERWILAQNAEKKCWENVTEDFVGEHSKDYIKNAEYLIKLLSKYKKINSKTKFLQIGCACTDIINYLSIGKRYSIDPLADFYKSKFSLDYDTTHFIAGKGEELPYKDNDFDVVILTNVLDHTQNPKKVLSEINRVLRKGGFLYFENHFYQKSFLTLSSLYSNFRKIFFKDIFNICHPYMFSLKELKNILTQEFEIIFEDEIGKDIWRGINNLSELKEFRKKEKLSRKIPALFGLLGIINFTCLCKKN